MLASEKLFYTSDLRKTNASYSLLLFQQGQSFVGEWSQGLTFLEFSLWNHMLLFVIK